MVNGGITCPKSGLFAWLLIYEFHSIFTSTFSTNVLKAVSNAKIANTVSYSTAVIDTSLDHSMGLMQIPRGPTELLLSSDIYSWGYFEIVTNLILNKSKCIEDTLL